MISWIIQNKLLEKTKSAFIRPIAPINGKRKSLSSDKSICNAFDYCKLECQRVLLRNIISDYFPNPLTLSLCLSLLLSNLHSNIKNMRQLPIRTNYYSSFHFHSRLISESFRKKNIHVVLLYK